MDFYFSGLRDTSYRNKSEGRLCDINSSLGSILTIESQGLSFEILLIDISVSQRQKLPQNVASMLLGMVGYLFLIKSQIKKL